MLDAVDLALRPGERVAVMGANGSGKSSALAVWAGLVAPRSGVASVFGVDPVSSPGAAARIVGLATAEAAGFSARLTVAENLRFVAALYGLDDVDARVAATEPATAIDEILGRRFQTLSAGQRARVGLCRALLHRPMALLLDEATRALDPGLSARLHRHLAAMAAGGAVVVVVTHDRAEAARMDRVILLGDGGIRADGPPGAVGAALDAAFASPA